MLPGCIKLCWYANSHQNGRVFFPRHGFLEIFLGGALNFASMTSFLTCLLDTFFVALLRIDIQIAEGWILKIIQGEFPSQFFGAAAAAKPKR